MLIAWVRQAFWPAFPHGEADFSHGLSVPPVRNYGDGFRRDAVFEPPLPAPRGSALTV